MPSPLHSSTAEHIKALHARDAKLPAQMFSSLWQIRSLADEAKQHLDGMDLEGLIEEAEEAKADLLELAKNRPAPIQPQPLKSEACMANQLATLPRL